MNIFAKAGAGLPLSPAQRAFLKLLEGFVLAAVVAALPVISIELARPGSAPDLRQLATVGMSAFGTAFLLAASKYYKAHGDTAISDVLAGAATLIPQPPSFPTPADMPPDETANGLPLATDAPTSIAA